MECRPRREEAKSKKNRSVLHRIHNKQVESGKQENQEPNSDSVEGGNNEDQHLTSDWDRPQSFKDNDSRKDRQEDATEDILRPKENGNYEWQWRDENGWEEGRKQESPNLQDVLTNRTNQKGYIIKTENGFRWIFLEEFITDEDTKSNVRGRVNDLVEKKTKILFIGPVGSGKSATINTLLGEDKALSENNLEANSLTKEITEYKSEYGILVDTPGLTEEHIPSVWEYLDRNQPDVIVIVFSASRLRSSQKEAIEEINNRLGSYFDKSVLLLTKGGDLPGNEHDFIDREKSKEIFSLHCSVGKRCVLFENLASMEEIQEYICNFKKSVQKILNGKKNPLTSMNENKFEEFLGFIRKLFKFRKS